MAALQTLLVPLFALFIAQSLSEMISSASTSPSEENKTDINDGNETRDTYMNMTTIGTQEPATEATKLESTTISKPDQTANGYTTTTPPKVSNTDAPTISQISQNPSISKRPLVSITSPKISTTAVTCNKTTSLLSESQKFTTLMFFFGLPIGLLLVLVGTLSVALLLVTRKRMTLRKDEEKGEGIEEKKEEENEKAKDEETEKKDEPVQEKEGSDVKESERKDDQIANEEANKESGQPADNKSSEAAKDELKKSEKEETKDQEQKQSAEQTTQESKQTSKEKGDSDVSQVKEGSKLTATVEVSDSKKSGQEKTEAVPNENKTSDDKSQEKSEKEKTTEEKIIKEDEAGENPVNDDFNASLDILSSFMKETENLMHDKTDENKKREDESLKENNVKPSDSTEVNDSEKKDDKSSQDDLVNSSQVASKTINTDRNSQGKEDATVQEEKPSKTASDEQREEDREKTENETNAIVKSNESQQEDLQNEDDPDLPLPPPPEEDNLNEDMTNEISGESTEISLPQPPRNSSSSSESEDP